MMRAASVRAAVTLQPPSRALPMPLRGDFLRPHIYAKSSRCGP